MVRAGRRIPKIDSKSGLATPANSLCVGIVRSHCLSAAHEAQLFSIAAMFADILRVHGNQKAVHEVATPRARKQKSIAFTCWRSGIARNTVKAI